MISARITRDCTLHRWTKLPDKDADGNEQHTFVDVPTKVELQQHSSDEMRDGRMVSVTVWAGYFRPDVAISAPDEVTIPGSGRFALEGDPWLVRHPRTGRSSHYLTRLRKVD